MPPTGDKRRRKDLDFFVLALVKDAISNPHALLKSAGLPPAATVPALGRLRRAGLIVSSTASGRRRTEHTITAKGRKHLLVGWRSLLESGPSGELEADLRVALLVLWKGLDREAAVLFLEASARLLCRPSCDPGQVGCGASFLASDYKKLRTAALDIVAKAEAVAALSVAQALPRFRTLENMSSKGSEKP